MYIINMKSVFNKGCHYYRQGRKALEEANSWLENAHYWEEVGNNTMAVSCRHMEKKAVNRYNLWQEALQEMPKEILIAIYRIYRG